MHISTPKHNTVIQVHTDIEDRLQEVFTDYPLLDLYTTKQITPYMSYTQLLMNNEEVYKEIFYKSTIVVIPNAYYQKHNYIPYVVCIRNLDFVLSKKHLHILNTIGIVHFNKLYYITNIGT